MHDRISGTGRGEAGRRGTGDPESSAAGACQAKSPPGLGEAGEDVRCLGRERSLLGVVEERRNCIAEEGRGLENDAACSVD